MVTDTDAICDKYRKKIFISILFESDLRCFSYFRCFTGLPPRRLTVLPRYGPGDNWESQESQGKVISYLTDSEL